MSQILEDINYFYVKALTIGLCSKKLLHLDAVMGMFSWIWTRPLTIEDGYPGNGCDFEDPSRYTITMFFASSELHDTDC